MDKIDAKWMVFMSIITAVGTVSNFILLGEILKQLRIAK